MLPTARAKVQHRLGFFCVRRSLDTSLSSTGYWCTPAVFSQALFLFA